jgi:hypothetical protein
MMSPFGSRIGRRKRLWMFRRPSQTFVTRLQRVGVL